MKKLLFVIFLASLFSCDNQLKYSVKHKNGSTEVSFMENRLSAQDAMLSNAGKAKKDSCLWVLVSMGNDTIYHYHR